jgi:beta-mannosidase
VKNYRSFKVFNLLVVVALILSSGQSAVVQRKSLNEIDREAFNPGPSPLEGAFETVQLKKGVVTMPAGAPVLLLDGEWRMAEGGEEAQRLKGEWEDAIPALVPGSVHTALWQAGKIPDPYFGLNDAIARAESYKTWWFKRTFDASDALKNPTLLFGGVANTCSIWLNGVKLGDHEGMFGGPDFDVRGLLKDKNTLVVKLDPIPYEGLEGVYAPDSDYSKVNQSWRRTVIFNNVYGWHYVNLPSLGIWRSVKVEGAPAVRIMHPFVATRNAQKGEIDLVVELDGGKNPVAGRLVGTIAPDNFEGDSHTFEHRIKSTGNRTTARLHMQVPEPRLWWPNNLGDPNLYTLNLAFVPDADGVPDSHEISFGIRTIEMKPWPEGNDPRDYNWRDNFDGFYDWTFVVNGRPMFVKGTGWCTMDPLMDFSRERYERLMILARDQHTQMFRAWGMGMPETDDFYDLCNRYGIMVMQEWPTGWNSHETQPYHLLEDTVRRNMLRLRNHPSLVLWGGGNESGQPFGPAIDMMGRLAVELDGTRDFHRSSPWGGSRHNYDLCWGQQPLDRALELEAAFWGEFGMRSLPNYESVKRYLPDDEKNAWPPPPGGSFEHHTPIFNRDDADMSRLRQFSGYFSEGKTMEDFIRGSQVASVTATRHTLELARTRWPASTGALYYKMNDNYPAASWACVDWYGAPKMNHYFFQQTYAPLHACLLFSTFDLDPPLDVEGRFGGGLDLTQGKREVAVPGGMDERPLTFSLWTKLNGFDQFNILLSVAPKTAPGKHWEVYTRRGTGELAVFIPGWRDFSSGVRLEKDTWYHLAYRVEEDGVTLYLDGQQVLSEKAPAGWTWSFDDWPLVIGGIAEATMRCDGVVDDVVVRSGSIPLEGVVPTGPAEWGEDTLVVLTFDDEASCLSPELPVYLLDDADALDDASWEVRVRAYDSDLKLVNGESYAGRGAIDRVKKLGAFKPDAAALSSNPLLFVVEVLREGEQANRTFYWTNFEAVKDSLFNLPKTQCSFEARGDHVVITNDGKLPAVGVNIQRPGHSDTFHASENYLWLEPGESKTITVNTTEGVQLEGWNL